MIVWNKVTWYSKLIALVLFVGLPFIGFYYGEQYGRTLTLVNGNQTSSSTVSQNSTQADYYSNVAEWQTDSNSTYFTIAYPIDFQVQDNYIAATSNDWRVNANNTPGIKYIILTVPKLFEPQTNFSDATLTVGSSSDSGAVAQCMVADPSGGPPSTTSTIMINGVQFGVFRSNDAGAGNYYETTSYRTIHAGKCYAVEYTIHSNQIANYPSSYNLKPFDETQINSLLQNIVGTFRFL